LENNVEERKSFAWVRTSEAVSKLKIPSWVGDPRPGNFQFADPKAGHRLPDDKVCQQALRNAISNTGGFHHAEVFWNFCFNLFDTTVRS
jgi:hypothetical protein